MRMKETRRERLNGKKDEGSRKRELEREREKGFLLF